MITVRRATERGPRAAREVVEVFADAFGPDFAYFSKNRARLADAFEHAIVPELFRVAVEDDRVVGIAAVTDGVESCLRLRGRDLRRHLGLLKGTIADVMLTREFSHAIPDLRPGAVSLEFVGTATAAQGRGVATALLRHLTAAPGEYLLAEVADTNARALALYERLGFVEYHRRPLKHSGGTGISAYVSLRMTTSGDPLSGS